MPENKDGREAQEREISRVEMDCAVATLLHAANVRGHELVLIATEYGKLDFLLLRSGTTRVVTGFIPTRRHLL